MFIKAEMKLTDAILPIAAIGIVAYFVMKNKSQDDSFVPSAVPFVQPVNEAKPSEQLFVKNPVTEAIRTAGTTKTPSTSKPSYKHEFLQKSVANSLSGVIPKITNTMTVSKEVANALKGTVSPLTGKVRI